MPGIHGKRFWEAAELEPSDRLLSLMMGTEVPKRKIMKIKTLENEVCRLRELVADACNMLKYGWGHLYKLDVVVDQVKNDNLRQNVN